MSGLLFSPSTTASAGAPAREPAAEVALSLQTLQALRRGVAARATEVGRTESVFGGLRFYRFMQPVGYESASHFTRDFKATYGNAPAEYARRLRDL